MNAQLEDVAKAIALECAPDTWDHLDARERSDFLNAAKVVGDLLLGPASVLAKVERFMRAADQPIATKGALPSPPLRLGRLEMLAGPTGDINAYLDAEREDDIAAITAGLWRTICTAYGTLLSYIGPDAAAETGSLVAEAELAKLSHGVVRDFIGRQRTPADWTPPNDAIKAVLVEHGLVTADA